MEERQDRQDGHERAQESSQKQENSQQGQSQERQERDYGQVRLEPGKVAMLSQAEIMGLLSVIRAKADGGIEGVNAAAHARSEAVETLFHHFRPLIVRTAKQYANLGFDEAIQEGHLSLLHAIHTYDESLGVPFAGYVFSKVRGDVRTAMRRIWRYDERVTHASGLRDEDGESIPVTDAWDRHAATAAATEEVWDDFDSADVRMAIAAVKLSRREKQAVLSILAGETCGELAMKAGVGTETVKTWRKRALHKLRAALGGEV